MEMSVVDNLNFCIFAYTRSIAILTNFLTDDIGSRNIKSMINWLKNDKYKVTTLNYSYIRKHGEKIYIYFLYDSYGLEEHEKRERFETTKEELIDVLKQWESMVEDKKKNRIIIKKEGNDILIKS